MKNETPEELFAKMKANTDLTDEEVWLEVARRSLKIRADRDGRVCVCGHPMGYHSGADEEERKMLEASGREVRVSCNPMKQECPCRAPRTALMAKNSRRFLMKTTGSRRAEHALYRGVMNSNSHDDPYLWLTTTCDRCKVNRTTDVYGMLPDMTRFTQGPAQNNFFICPSCRIEVQSA